jgi:hypothetical protein
MWQGSDCPDLARLLWHVPRKGGSYVMVLDVLGLAGLQIGVVRSSSSLSAREPDDATYVDVALLLGVRRGTIFVWKTRKWQRN